MDAWAPAVPAKAGNRNESVRTRVKTCLIASYYNLPTVGRSSVSIAKGSLTVPMTQHLRTEKIEVQSVIFVKAPRFDLQGCEVKSELIAQYLVCGPENFRSVVSQGCAQMR